MTAIARDHTLQLPSTLMRRMAATLAIACLIWAGMRWHRDDGSIASLVSTMSGQSTRFIEARLTGGFAWAPYASHRSRSLQPFEVTAASFLSGARGSRSVGDPQARAIALLLLDRATDAVALLDPAASALGDARVWSDLAAANYHVAVTSGDGRRLGQALAAADAALRMDARLPEALFNRALVLERFGWRDLAREAWERYLGVDTTTEWASEARTRIGSLGEIPPFRDVLSKHYDQLAADAAAARVFSARYPQECRTWGETEILGRWATAYLANDEPAARTHLDVARNLGEGLIRHRADRMLAAAVAAIDRADPAGRELLAAGHVAFRDGQKAYRGNKASAAHQLFGRAVDDLERGRSPVALLAQYFLANTTYDAGRVAEAMAIHERLLRSAPPEFEAHRAQLQWQLGRAYMLAGRWGDALVTLAAGAVGFERLGERNYAAIVHEIRAEAYDRIGDPANAWRERMASLQELGRQLTPRLLIAISSMSRAAMVAGEWQQASSFLDIELEVCRRVGTPMRKVEMLLLRAQLNHRLGMMAAARNDLADARAEIVRLADPALSTLLAEQADVTEAMLAPSAREALPLLTKAIASFQPRGRRIYLPEVLLQRGRIYTSIGQRDAAAADFEAGIAELEGGRETLPQGESRWGILNSVEGLFAEAIRLALSEGDPARALSYAERARARQLRDELGAGESRITPSDIPADTALVEYVVLDDRLVVLVADRRGVVAVERPADRHDIVERIERFTQLLRSRDMKAIGSVSADLHELLIAPISNEIKSSERVILIPDRFLSGVAFAALLDPDGRYLIERHELVVSPSAAVFLRLARRDERTHGGSKLLLIANPDRKGAEVPLNLAEREADSIAQLYPTVTMLSKEQATVEAFGRHAPTATVIHFAGHAIAEGGPNTALLFARSDASDGRAEASTIAAMDLSHTRLVILSACNTANGDIAGSEGPISLARAFLAAGVPSVIATTQPLDDRDAAQFFPRLHELLATGATPAEALREAQLEWIHRPGGLTTWAATQIIGR